MARPPKWTDEQRTEVLARLQAGESIRAVSRALEMPVATIHAMAVAAEHEFAERVPERSKIDYGELALAAAERCRQRVLEALPNAGVRDAAIAYGIFIDKALDMTLGRKGAVVNVDARHQSLTIPPGLTVDELRALANGMDAEK